MTLIGDRLTDADPIPHCLTTVAPVDYATPQMARNVHARNDWTYVSGARSLLRLMWFLDFVFVLLTR